MSWKAIHPFANSRLGPWSGRRTGASTVAGVEVVAAARGNLVRWWTWLDSVAHAAGAGPVAGLCSGSRESGARVSAGNAFEVTGFRLSERHRGR